MKILKHGDLKPRKFICTSCDCEFVADKMEYHLTGHIEETYTICCPECEYYIIAPAKSAPIYNKDINNKLTKIIDRLDKYVHENISIYDHDIYVNLCSIIDELIDWQKEYNND